MGDARIVEGVVELPECIHRGRHQASHLIFVGHVCFEEQALSPLGLYQCLCLGSSLRIAVGYCDLGPPPSEEHGGCLADPAGATGHQCHLAIH